MLFSSLSFLFLFLPPVLILYHIHPSPRWRNGVLLVSSLLFYAWGAPKALPLLVGTAALVWLCGLGMEKGRRFCFPLAVGFVLGSLMLFKYLGFFARIFGAQPGFSLLLPAGISFYSFQLLAYSLDLRRGAIRAERRFGRFLLYVSFFPQLLQGPILRYDKTAPMLGERPVGRDAVLYGMRRFLIGLAKKVLLADQAAAVAAWHSKGRASANVPVDYVPVRYVKKPSGAKPGMVIFTNNRTVYVDPKLPESAK